MALEQVKKQHSENRVLNEFQDSVKTFTDQIGGIAFLDGRLLDAEDLVSGDNTIEHGLGRKLNGWLIMRQNAAATFYDKQDTNTLDDRTLILNASAAVTVALWVF